MRYHNITKDDMLNGDGLRVVLWEAGCEHHCPGCQNPITWDINGGLPFDDAAKQEIFDELDKPYISGITFSGGDPLHTCNRADTAKLINEIKAKYPSKTVWIYTGYDWDDIKDLPLLKNTDVLIDGRYIEKRRNVNLYWRGSENQRVIDVKKSLDKGAVVLHCE